MKRMQPMYEKIKQFLKRDLVWIILFTPLTYLTLRGVSYCVLHLGGLGFNLLFLIVFLIVSNCGIFLRETLKSIYRKIRERIERNLTLSLSLGIVSIVPVSLFLKWIVNCVTDFLCAKFDIESDLDPSTQNIIVFTLSLGGFIVTIYAMQQREKQLNRIDKQITQSQKQIESQAKARLDDKFGKGLELLGTKNLLTQKGGAHLLKTLAIESPKHREKCLDALTYVNEWMKDASDNLFTVYRYHSNGETKTEVWHEKRTLNNKEKLSKETLEIIESVIRHVVKEEELKEDSPTSFASKHLCGLRLSGINEPISRYFDFNGADIRGSDLTGANLQEAELECSKLSYSILFNTNLHGAKLNSIKLKEVNSSDNPFCKGVCLERVNLSNSSLLDIELEGISLIGAKLQGADLTRAKLCRSNLTNANLQGAILTAADLREADLTNSNLQGAQLCNTKLQIAYLNSTSLQGAKLCNKINGLRCDTILNGAIIINANLIGAGINGIHGHFLSDGNFTSNDVWEGKTIDDIIKESIPENVPQNIKDKIEPKLRNAYDRYKKAKELKKAIDLSNHIASKKEHYDSILNTWIKISKENPSYVRELLYNVINAYNSLKDESSKELKKNIRALAVRFYDDYIVKNNISIDDKTKNNIEKIRKDFGKNK